MLGSPLNLEEIGCGGDGSGQQRPMVEDRESAVVERGQELGELGGIGGPLCFLEGGTRVDARLNGADNRPKPREQPFVRGLWKVPVHHRSIADPVNSDPCRLRWGGHDTVRWMSGRHRNRSHRSGDRREGAGGPARVHDTPYTGNSGHHRGDAIPGGPWLDGRSEDRVTPWNVSRW